VERATALLAAVTDASAAPGGGTAGGPVDDAVVARLVSLGPQVSGELARWASHRRGRSSVLATRALGQLGHGCALAPLLRLASGPPGPTRWEAALALALRGEPEGWRVGLEVALGDDAAAPRELFSGLRRSVRRHPQQREALAGLLVNTLERSPPASTRVACARLLASVPGASAEAAALALLSGDPDPLVRAAAARSLRGQLSPSSVAPVAARLSDPHPAVAAAAARALGSSALPAQAAPPLAEHLRLERPWARGAAVAALTELGGDVAQGALMEVLRTERGYLGAAALRGLVVLTDPQMARELLLEGLRSDSRQLRHMALDLLGTRRVYEALPHLKRAARAPGDVELRRRAAALVRRWRRPE